MTEAYERAKVWRLMAPKRGAIYKLTAHHWVCPGCMELAIALPWPGKRGGYFIVCDSCDTAWHWGSTCHRKLNLGDRQQHERHRESEKKKEGK